MKIQAREELAQRLGVAVVRLTATTREERMGLHELAKYLQKQGIPATRLDNKPNETKHIELVLTRPPYSK